MKDLISKQAAIDALEKEKPTPFVNKDGSIDPFGVGRQNQWYRDGIAIMNLPSAEPEIIRCKDCKHRREDECPMYHVEWVEYDDDGYIESDDVIHDYTEDDGYCHMAEKREDEE